MSTDTMTTTQVNRVFIKATPEAIWNAITQPEWSDRYGYGGKVDYDLRAGGAYKAYASEAMKQAGVAGGFPVPDVVVDGEVIEAAPPARLVQTFRMLMDPEVAEEGFTRLTYEIEQRKGGVCQLTVTHELEGAPKLQLIVSGSLGETAGGGWAWILSDLKTLLETGSAMDPGDGLNQG